MPSFLTAGSLTPLAPKASCSRPVRLAVLGGLMLLAAPAAAQTGGTLPLVSVGDKWPQAQETYVIRVSAQDAGKNLGLEVFSPTFNLADYVDGRRAEGYFGDELYAKNEPFETTFTLTGPGGTVLERRFSLNREHTWDSLFSGGLGAGTYTLKVTSRGNGKNSFALRVADPFRLETSDFSVNARSTDSEALLAARVNVTADWVGRTLGLLNYDVDGPQEAEIWAVQPGGTRVNLTPSENGRTATDAFRITPELVGEWQLYIRVLKTTKQYSNAIRFSFRLNDQPITGSVGGFVVPGGAKIANQLLVDVVDPQGRPIPGASYALVGDAVVRPVLPGGYVPVSGTLIQGTGNIVSPTEVRYQPGFTKIRFVARPPQGQLQVEAVALYAGQRIPLTGVPFQVGGQTLSAPVTVPLAPGDYPVTPTSLPGSSVTPPPAGRVTDSGTERVTIEYRVLTDVALVTSPDILNVCDVTQLTALARTDFPYRLPGKLSLNLPTGWTTDYPLNVSGDFSQGQPLRLKVPVRVCRTDTAEAVLDPVDLRTTGQARVRNPGGANVTRNVQGGARASLNKSVEAAAQGQGYVVTLVFTVDSTLENVRLIDPLPGGGAQPAVRGPLQVQGPSLANLNPRLDGDAILLTRVIPGTYTLTYTLFTDQPADRVVTAPDLSW
ncbi:hypothetical protein [Deinococcus daejeonensis]|uniref:Uncharacterized protein n=1 Tax=Deinococcus daejeonensis TaxID=1007098 RepID=A0ABQ2JAI1_9DEIO|nr:hypothetical protein [Deinococcus daejeonensis]GGN43615.1 hypothetical protein GCM10010842_31290 [Deinococcus daejeonensis]